MKLQYSPKNCNLFKGWPEEYTDKRKVQVWFFSDAFGKGRRR